MKSLTLALASLVPLSLPELAVVKKVPHSEDLTKSPTLAKIMLHRIAQHWELDFSKVKISGFLQMEGKPYDEDVRVTFNRGETCEHELYFEGFGYGGEITVEGDPSAIGRDLGNEVAEKWLTAQGLPADYPVDVRSTVTAAGGFRVEVIPCA